MSSSHNNGYDVVVDVDDEGDLGHTDLTDLEFHQSTYSTTDPSAGKAGRSSARSPRTAGGPSNSTSTPSGKHHLFTLSFYAQYFDVDTSTVLHRCRSALIPRTNFLDIIDGNPDLYGPIWITTSVVLMLFLASTLAQYFARFGEEGDGGGKRYTYDFTLLSGAAGMMYGYTFIVPAALWVVLRWWGVESANLLELACLYGYANLVWLPVAVASVSPITILNWVFVGVGLASSGLFLFRNLYPVVSATDHRTAKILLIVVVALHAGLALAIKILFFAHGSPVGTKDPNMTHPVEPPKSDGRLF
ncbi:Yip1-domain-containing protein [Ascodesmis nigricans]|uniref:Protein YIP n=1 Tax=Ascodesmis nigricans TaxID=341454 RepID=A0A4S2N223_9PEZI|nr:Yip1-domain-containing protein [Ascodesmis nigricans]